MSWEIFFRELPGLFLSWWGVFGCTFPPAGFYVFCALVTLGGLAGLVAARRELRRPQMMTLLLWAVLMGISYVRWNWITHAAKGRLLYPMMVVVAALLGRGWETWAARWPLIARLVMGALALVALVIPFTVMAPPVTPPPTYADANAVTPQVALAGQFGDSIALLGYDLNAHTFNPGDELALTLYWQALAPLDAALFAGRAARLGAARRYDDAPQLQHLAGRRQRAHRLLATRRGHRRPLPAGYSRVGRARAGLDAANRALRPGNRRAPALHGHRRRGPADPGARGGGG
jgi:hypothetical protein